MPARTARVQGAVFSLIVFSRNPMLYVCSCRGSAQGFAQQRRELLRFLEEGVVDVGRLQHFQRGRAAQAALQLAEVGQRYQPVGGKADQGGRQRHPLRLHIVQVDGLGQREEALRVEALDKAAPLVFQVVLDREVEAV